MDQARASITALGAALMRAVYSRTSASPLIADPWGDRLVLNQERDLVLKVVLNGLSQQDRERCENLESLNTMLDCALQAHPGYGWAVLRTRYAEDALQVAVERGTRQYVIMGAGLDSFALRQPSFAQDVDVFEIDHPATQDLKRQRLNHCGVPVPDRLHFIPADLSREQVGAVLMRSPFRSTDPAFFSWLGVTQYLTREANLDTLRSIAACAAAESELVFTYVEQAALDSGGASSRVARLQGAFAAAREPWLSGFDPFELAEDLAAVGLILIEDLDGQAAKSRYQADDLNPIGPSHIARATISA